MLTSLSLAALAILPSANALVGKNDVVSLVLESIMYSANIDY